ncbi:hypothetical protein GQ53DRAFT_788685 [Thozetella sp. PMI_491]|nr:hypothetical protein GQ53DRAFT_788685 [Thozetella sp. PMI_491]
MAWDHLSITKPHLVYIILGGFTSLFMLCSSVIKERMYIGEATVATLCGLIFGPHAANLIDPQSWGSVDIVTIEFSRLVLVVQCFAVGVELPKFYMEKHWKSVVFLLVPVMTFGWLVTALIIWWMVVPLNWLESMVVAACVTATDPVLASSVVGKGKFAKRVPKHLRDLLSAESGCNDGMAFPFIYLSIYLIQEHQSAKEVSFHWIVYTILYECVFGAIFGFLVGYFARHGIKYAEKKELIDRESFLVFYFVLALFCAGSGSILGVDDLLVGFAAGVGFSNDGWFTQKTEEAHVSNVIDLLLNLAYFVFLGTIIPWEQFNDASIGLEAWRLVIIALFVILFRRIPIMMALKPLIPDIKTWREALFAGHFGPIGVGAIFVAILARAELEHDEPVPLSELPPKDHEHYQLLLLVWPIVTFLVVASIIVHGSSIAVFTLGKHINTLSITMSYTAAPEDGPSWMNRLPRISSMSRSQARTMSDTDVDEYKMPEVPPGTLPPVGIPGQFLRRVKEEDAPSKQGSRASSLVSRRRRKKWDDGIGPGGPITQSAIFPQRNGQNDRISSTLQPESSSLSPVDRSDSNFLSPRDAVRRPRPRERDPEKAAQSPEETPPDSQQEGRGSVEVYAEGDNLVIENEDGDVLAVTPAPDPEGQDQTKHAEELKMKLAESAAEPGSWTTYAGIKKKLDNWREGEIQKRKEREKGVRRHEPARAYQFGNTIIVEDEDGEVVKKYELSPQKDSGDILNQSLKYIGMGGLVKAGEKAKPGEGVEEEAETTEVSKVTSRPVIPNWATGAFGRPAAGEPSTRPGRRKTVAEEEEEEDDRHIRFTIGGVGQRMTKEDFIREMQQFDKNTRNEIIDQSSASQGVKDLAQHGDAAAGQSSRGKGVAAPASPPSRDESPEASSPERRGRRASSTSPSPRSSPTRGAEPSSREEPETAVERRRRLAVLQSVGSDGEDMGETPAERRRREAALGMSSPTAADDDSDDDDTPRVPPQRRGITFADVPDRERR